MVSSSSLLARNQRIAITSPKNIGLFYILFRIDEFLHNLLLRQQKDAKEFQAQTVILNEVKDPSSIPTMPYGFFASLRMTANNKPH
jgi:hypothetical protein